jgi:PAS domain S-box-containing protein
MFEPTVASIHSLHTAIVESAEDAIITTDLDGLVTSWNKSAEKIFGYTREEMIQQPIAMLFRPERRDEMTAILERISRRERVDHYETVRIGKDARPLNISLTVSPIYDDGGLVVGTSQIVRDISGSIAAQHVLARQVDRLMRANFNLQQCLRMMSRSLTEPLQRNAAYIDVLLTYARMFQDERLTSQVEIAEVVESAIDSLRDLIRSSGAQITFNGDPLPVVQGNKPALVLLFQHLLGNALTYRGPQPPRIEITVLPQLNRCQFAVRDNGVGIAPTHHQCIFEEFHRLHGSENPGMGIGLTLCRKIVDWHEGSIWVESDAGRGATFYFNLPTR